MLLRKGQHTLFFRPLPFPALELRLPFLRLPHMSRLAKEQRI